MGWPKLERGIEILKITVPESDPALKSVMLTVFFILIPEETIRTEGWAR
jgi:hypothetical protein